MSLVTVTRSRSINVTERRHLIHANRFVFGQKDQDHVYCVQWWPRTAFHDSDLVVLKWHYHKHQTPWWQLDDEVGRHNLCWSAALSPRVQLQPQGVEAKMRWELHRPRWAERWASSQDQDQTRRPERAAHRVIVKPEWQQAAVEGRENIVEHLNTAWIPPQEQLNMRTHDQERPRPCWLPDSATPASSLAFPQLHLEDKVWTSHAIVD